MPTIRFSRYQKQVLGNLQVSVRCRHLTCTETWSCLSPTSLCLHRRNRKLRILACVTLCSLFVCLKQACRKGYILLLFEEWAPQRIKAHQEKALSVAGGHCESGRVQVSWSSESLSKLCSYLDRLSESKFASYLEYYCGSIQTAFGASNWANEKKRLRD